MNSPLVLTLLNLLKKDKVWECDHKVFEVRVVDFVIVFSNTDGLVYVVDSADDMRLKECADELISLLQEEALKNVPMLVFANK